MVRRPACPAHTAGPPTQRMNTTLTSERQPLCSGPRTPRHAPLAPKLGECGQSCSNSPEAAAHGQQECGGPPRSWQLALPPPYRHTSRTPAAELRSFRRPPSQHRLISRVRSSDAHGPSSGTRRRAGGGGSGRRSVGGPATAGRPAAVQPHRGVWINERDPWIMEGTYGCAGNVHRRHCSLSGPLWVRLGDARSGDWAASPVPCHSCAS